MKSTIESLWNGNITPAENCGCDDTEIEALIALMERNKHALNNALDSHQQVIFEKYVDCTEEYMTLISMRAFRDGFCLAVKLITEAVL